VEKHWLKAYPPGVDAEIDMSEYPSLKELIERGLAIHSVRDAYVQMGKAITYGDIDILSMQFGAFLQHSCGLKKGDRVALMMPNTLQYPIAILGALRAGFTVVNTNPLYTTRELEHQLSDSGATVIVILENFAHVLQEVIAHTPIKHVIVTSVGEMLGFPKGNIVDFVVRHKRKQVKPFNLPGSKSFKQALKEGSEVRLQAVKLTHSDIAFLQYTGGTTGVAKGAMLTHGNMVANVLQALEWIGPSFPRDPANALLHTPGFDKLDFTELKLTLGGGMAVQEAVAKKWKEVTGKILTQAWGLTETSPAACINKPGEDFNGSIGYPIPSTEISIRDDDGNELGINAVGEICVRGPQVMAGYWNRPDETAKVMIGSDVLRTGDIGRIDEQGLVFIEDRKKDMILVSGFNVYPNEVESVAVTHPGVLEAAAIAQPDEKSGEIVALFVVKKDPNLTEQELIEHCKKALTGYKVPKHVYFRTDLPKTNVGKILRRALRDELPK
jgi:long-chain acyl-CoA synthetase